MSVIMYETREGQLADDMKETIDAADTFLLPYFKEARPNSVALKAAAHVLNFQDIIRRLDSDKDDLNSTEHKLLDFERMRLVSEERVLMCDPAFADAHDRFQDAYYSLQTKNSDGTRARNRDASFCHRTADRYFREAIESIRDQFRTSKDST